MRFLFPVYRDIATVMPLDTLPTAGAQSPTVSYFMSTITYVSSFSSFGLCRPHFNLKKTSQASQLILVKILKFNDTIYISTKILKYLSKNFAKYI